MPAGGSDAVSGLPKAQVSLEVGFGRAMEGPGMTARTAQDAAAAPARTDAPCGVKARGVSKSFGRTHAVRGVSFDLPSRGVCGILGPNGAGKTTTIRMVAGVLVPDSGDLEVAGLDVRRHGTAVRAAVGYLPESAPLYPELTVDEYMAFRAGLAGMPRALVREATTRALERCDVARFRSRCCGTLSKGTQQRVGLAAAILGEPKVLILDEPSVGLDPAQTLAFRAIVRELGATRLVLFSSHLLSEVESVCSELMVVAHGRIAAHEPMAAFRARASAGAAFVAETERPFAGSSEFTALVTDARETALADGWTRTVFRVRADSGADALARALVDARIAARVLAPESADLEDVFVSIVRAAAAGEAP